MYAIAMYMLYKYTYILFITNYVIQHSTRVSRRMLMGGISASKLRLLIVFGGPPDLKMFLDRYSNSFSIWSCLTTSDRQNRMVGYETN